MDSASSHQPGKRKPKRLKSLASSVEFRGRNSLLHQFVLVNSYPNESGSVNYVNAVLISMVGVPANVVNGEGYTALHLAVIKNNLVMVKKLLSCLLDIDVNARTRWDFKDTALHLAAHSGNLSIVKELLDQGAGIDDERKYGETALCIATQSRHLDVIKLLVSKGADVNHKRSYINSNPLSAAVLSKNLEAVVFLVNSGAYVTIRTGYTPLHAAVSSGSLEIVEFLVNNGADLNAKDKDKDTPFHYAVFKKNFKILKFLMRKGADLQARNEIGKTPLHCAVCCKSLVNIAWLMNQRADLDAVDEVRRRRTPIEAGFLSHCLHDAISSVRSSLDIVEFCISEGADLRALDRDGKTPLHHAMIGCVAAFLVDQGAEVDATDVNGWTPLHEAAYKRRAGVVRVLVAKGADRSAKNKDGKTPLDLVRLKENRSWMSADWKSVIDALQNVMKY